jgi:D-alanine transaminase
VLPVVSIDGRPIADGTPGATTRRIHALYAEFARAAAQSA